MNFEKVLVGKALKLKGPVTAIPILETSGSDLISYLLDQRRITIIGFDIFKSYWPVDVSFPIFLSNLIDLYSRAGGGAARPRLATGSTIPIFPDKESKSAEVTMPGDRSHAEFRGLPDGVSHFHNSRRDIPGRHEFGEEADAPP